MSKRKPREASDRASEFLLHDAYFATHMETCLEFQKLLNVVVDYLLNESEENQDV